MSLALTVGEKFNFKVYIGSKVAARSVAKNKTQAVVRVILLPCALAVKTIDVIFADGQFIRKSQKPQNVFGVKRDLARSLSG